MDRIVSPKRIKDYAVRYPTSKPSLQHWLETMRGGEWRNPSELKASFHDVDPVTVGSSRTVYVFNIEHNRHRLIAAIHFNTKTVYVLRIMTHQEYSRNRWKEEL
jgi:mRNA interferase HigB